ncbi:MAG: phosphatase PAP2 family protein [Cyclobacteriaceae bacterium]|nr:phosphatase PAP2 family protein [Cyclobacteriaceae bacterium]
MKKHNPSQLFYKVYIILFSIGILSLFFIEKGDMVILINGFNNPFSDLFFKYVTYIGDGILFVPLILGLVFIRYSFAIMGTIIAVSHGLLLSLLKKIIFKGEPRPTAYFEDTSMLHFVEGVKVHTSNSFPSGHTATAFAFCLFLTFLVNRKSWSSIFLVLALLAGYSRIYLLQHFYMDVVVGGFIGTLVTIITWKLFEIKNIPDWMNKKLKLNNS